MHTHTFIETKKSLCKCTVVVCFLYFTLKDVPTCIDFLTLCTFKFVLLFFFL